MMGIQMNTSYSGYYYTPEVNRVDRMNPLIQEDNKVNTTGKLMPTECRTCAERRYVDGSNEGNVSFKSPGYISPGASAAVVSAHEQEHVANAVTKGNEENAELVSASVRLKTAICPECGTAYVSGGVTETQIKYKINNPYEQAKKTVEGSLLLGMNVDYAA